MPTNAAVLTTTGRRSGKPRTTFFRAYRDASKAYLVSITGEHALWLKNIRANPEVTLRFRRDTLTGIARDPHNDAERQAVHAAFCGSTHPFDYGENMLHRTGLPTRTKIIELHAVWLEGGTPVIVDVTSCRSTLKQKSTFVPARPGPRIIAIAGDRRAVVIWPASGRSSHRLGRFSWNLRTTEGNQLLTGQRRRDRYQGPARR